MTCPPALASGPRLSHEPTLQRGDFERAARIVLETCGIRLHEGKEMLVRARLIPRLRELGCRSFSAYLDRIEAEPARAELAEMIDLLTTNKTGFFRENKHFEFLNDEVFPDLRRTGRRPRFWSAGCSSGEEPYTISIACLEAGLRGLEDGPVILATDISRRMLTHARRGVYDRYALADMPQHLLSRYFDPASNDEWTVRPPVRRNVAYATLNLIHRWPMQGPFDVIFFRNVAIYFDRATQRRLAERLAGLLRPGGHLFIGHAETLGPGCSFLDYVCPAIYRRPPGDPPTELP